MKVYEIIIQPATGFGTPLKGDTIFGHLCWQIAYDEALLGTKLTDLLAAYHEKPFAVLSSAYPSFVREGIRHYAARSPSLPMDWMFSLPADKKEKIKKRKEYKKKVWMVLEKDKPFSSFKETQFLDDSELAQKMNGARSTVPYSQTRNKINRLTGRTGEGFAPFVIDQQIYPPDTELVLFVGVDPDLAGIDGIRECLGKIGSTGFGKDASTGLGRFRLGDTSEVDLAGMGSETPDACYTLSPCVPEKNAFTNVYFDPFTRFGRHGDVLAKSRNPFKNPVIMADEGAVVVPHDMGRILKRPYIGTAMRGVSKTEERTVTQGYSLYIPVSMEVNDG